ncbi:MAG: twin-arginine translocase subunit TatC [Chthoniobacteraceae bacterium]
MLFNILTKLFSLREKRPSDQRDESGDIVKPFLDHMEDLRWVVMKVLLVLVTAMVASFWNRQELMQLLQYPLHIADPTGELAKTIRSDNIIDSFMISFKMAFYVGIIVALPFILYFIADFVLPALTKKEKRVLIPGFLIGVVFFSAGASASYLYITPHTLAFFWKDATEVMGLNTLWTWRSYISFFTWLTIGFGLMCEVPLIVMLLAGFGIVNYKLLSATRNYAYVAILVLAAIVAPTPDPITFLILAAPIIAMYESCIWIVWALEGRKRKREKQAAVNELVS